MSRPPFAADAAAFDLAVPAYDRGRPAYPVAAARHIATAFDLEPGSRVVEVGAGTGKCTRALVEAGLRPVAVEPLAGMIGVVRRDLPDCAAIRAVAERLPLAADCVDAIVVANAFHWFDPERAVAEFRRVLRAGGGLALAWQVRDDQSPPWDRISPILDRYRGVHPSSQDHVAAVGEPPGFGPIERWSFPNHEVRPPGDVVARVLSVSFIAALPEAERRAVAAEVRALVAVPGGQPVTLRYDVEVLTARRR